MQTREVLRESVAERLGFDSPRMTQFMLHANLFLRTNDIVAIHSSGFDLRYVDQNRQKGLYYQEVERGTHRIWVFVKEEKSRRTQAHVVDIYTRKIIPVQVYGREGLSEAIGRAEQNLTVAQKTMIKSSLG